MLFAPPTHSHEDRLTRPRLCSSPTSSRSPPVGVRHPTTASRSPPSLARHSPTRDPPRPLPMSTLHDFPVSSSHATTPRRSPQTTPTLSSSLSSHGLPSLSSGGSSATNSLASSLPHIPGTAGSSSSVHHPLLGYFPHGNKILSRNLNGTLAVTSQPSNESELQLFRVLQRANLLNYYETFISQGSVQGGDDVQQLCEAGEEEFLEIMALVGMASKPLHVRRLQKGLQEWVSNPSVFQIPMIPNLPQSIVTGFQTFPSRTIVGGSTTPTPTSRPSPPMSTTAQNHISSPGLSKETNQNSMGACSPREPTVSTSSGLAIIPNSRDTCGLGMGAGGSRGTSPALPPTSVHPTSHLPPSTLPLQNCGTGVGLEKPEFFLSFMKSQGCESPGLSYPPPSGSPGGGSPGSHSPQGATPTLHEAQIARLAQSASELAANLPPLEVRKDAMNKRKMSKELEDLTQINSSFWQMIMNMSEDDPRRMDELRKYAAIYGRFDCKRKPEKPLTLHEVSVNEAAAQICKYMPALLTRRDELFPLARQVVRDSGYQYSKGHSRSQTVIGREDEPPRSKRTRTDSGPDTMDHKPELHWKKRQERLEAISEELRAMSDRAEEVRNSLTSGTGNLVDLTQQMDALQTRHAQLTLEQNELLKAHQKSFLPRSRSERSCSEEARDDSDSQFSYSANNSPSQVISSSQGNIIAVANPALSLSSAMPVSHAMHEDDRHPLYAIPSKQHNICSIKQEPGSPAHTKLE